MFTNPENVQNLVASNPFLQALVQSNPQIAGMLNDPMMLQMLADPQIFNGFLSMVGGVGGVQALIASTPSPQSKEIYFGKTIICIAQTNTTTTTATTAKPEAQTTTTQTPPGKNSILGDFL